MALMACALWAYTKQGGCKPMLFRLQPRSYDGPPMGRRARGGVSYTPVCATVPSTPQAISRTSFISEDRRAHSFGVFCATVCRVRGTGFLARPSGAARCKHSYADGRRPDGLGSPSYVRTENLFTFWNKSFVDGSIYRGASAFAKRQLCEAEQLFSPGAQFRATFSPFRA